MIASARANKNIFHPCRFIVSTLEKTLLAGGSPACVRIPGPNSEYTSSSQQIGETPVTGNPDEGKIISIYLLGIYYNSERLSKQNHIPSLQICFKYPREAFPEAEVVWLYADPRS